MKRLFLVIVLFTLPMLACAITPEIEAILALVQFEIVTTIQEDGSGTVEIGVGSNEIKEDGEFLVECTDDQLEDLPHILHGLKMVAAVAELASDLDQTPCL